MNRWLPAAFVAALVAFALLGWFFMAKPHLNLGGLKLPSASQQAAKCAAKAKISSGFSDISYSFDSEHR